MKKNELERFIETVELLKKHKAISGNADIVKALGYRRENTISDIINGRAALTGKFLSAFAMAYDVNLDWLKTGKGLRFADGDLPKTTNSVEAPTLQGGPMTKEDMETMLAVFIAHSNRKREIPKEKEIEYRMKINTQPGPDLLVEILHRLDEIENKNK